MALAAGCGVRPNNLRSPTTAPAAVPGSPTAPIPPAGETTPAAGRSTTSRGPFPPSAPVDGPDAGL